MKSTAALTGDVRHVLGRSPRHRRVAHVDEKGALVDNPGAAGRGAEYGAAGRGAVVGGHVLLARDYDAARGNLLTARRDGPSQRRRRHPLSAINISCNI